MNNAPITVVVVESDRLVCRALLRLLSNSTEVQVIAASPDRDEAIELVRRLRPAIALVDAHIALPRSQPDGGPATEGLWQQAPATQIIVLGVYEALREEALRSGACRFLLKDGTRAELVEAIQLAARGECESVIGGLGESASVGG